MSESAAETIVYLPQRNKPLPFKRRYMPWEKRRGAKVWPNGARMAFVSYCALEMWDWGGPRIQGVPIGRPFARSYTTMGITPLDARTSVEYGGEIGCRRLKEVLEELGIAKQFVVLVCGSYAEDFPEQVKAFADIGCEINAHTYSYSIGTVELTKEQQREDMRKTVRILQQVTGQKPVSWLSQGAGCDANTVELLAEEGFLCHCDLQDDELPYFIDVNGKTIVEVPYRMAGNLNDHFILTPMNYKLSDALGYLKEKFDRLYEDCAKYPKHTNLGTHPMISGRADSMWVFSEFFKYVKSFPDVWIATYKDIAEWWMKQYGEGYPV